MNVQQERAEADAAFAQGFASVVGTEVPAPTAASTDATAGVEAPDEPGPTPDAGKSAGAGAPAQDGNGAAPGDAPAADPAGGDPAKGQPAAEDDPVLLDGLKRSELRRLLGNAADVDTLRKQLDKAHGNIGALNRELQQVKAVAPAAAPAPATAPELPPELKQFEEDYPEVAAYVKALGITPQQPRQEAPPAEPQQPVATGGEGEASAGLDPMALELAVMDRMHKGWREKVGSPEFSLWLTTQGDEAQQAFGTASTADDLAAVIGNYDQWANARTAAADKTAKAQQRLKAAVTPAGNAQRPQAAPTEDEAFRAAFAAQMGKR
ncbi:hypothetical protein RCH27_08530 [Paracidovorax citrulli]|uniref:hypothetical protein n=1 Tax=Paracidovorax citrulli TaxID=80869 RepID=UPI003A809F9F